MKSVLMITPYHANQRGNSITSARLHSGLIDRGFRVDILSLEANHWHTDLQKMTDNHNYGLIHAFHALHFAKVLKVMGEPGIPLLLTMTGTDIHFDLPGKDRDTVIAVLKAVQKIVVFHDDLKDIVISSVPDLSGKVVTIPQGLSLPHNNPRNRQELGLRSDDTVFVLPSGLRPVKNIELAIDALQLIQKDYPYLRLLIVGAVIDKQYGQSVLDRIAGLEWITFLGEIPHEEMSAVLSASDVVINTSLAEGQPQSVLEGMSLGKPCILTAVPGNLNIIEHGREGFYAGNTQDLAQAVQTLLVNKSLQTKMGRSARELVEKSFTSAGELDAYSEIYHKLMD